MAGLSDELLLANEIGYVNGVWEKVNAHRTARKQEVQYLRSSFDDLKTFQQKGSGGYLTSMRENLINIAFILEPGVDELIKERVATEDKKYHDEHASNDLFYEDIVKQESDKFDVLYNQWKQSVVRFHFLKQEEAISKFLARVNSNEFVNPESRIQLFG